MGTTTSKLIALVLAGLAWAGLATVPAKAVPSGIAERKALVVQVTWAAANGMPSAPADRTLTSITDAVGVTAKAWYKSVSRGMFPGWTATGIGPVQIPTPSNDNCDAAFQYDVMAGAKAAARARGLDPASFNTTVVYFSRSYCDWAGLSDGTNVWLNARVDTGTVVQELGHTLQLGHGLALRCKDAAGNTVPLSNTCTIVGYGDPFNAMGSGTGSFSGIQQDDLGWLGSRLRTATSDVTTYALAPLENAGTSVQVLKVPDGDGTLWIEYRRRIGVDASMYEGTDGVFIRREMPGQGRKSILLDMNPSEHFFDARLPVGASYLTPVGKVRVRVDSQDERGALLTVTMTTSTVPNVLDKSESGARQALTAANYVNKVVYVADDASCDDIGFVVKQSPAGGTKLTTGSTVTVTVAKPPAGGCR